MKLEQFQELAPKTLNTLEPMLQLAHMAMGMAGEIKEMLVAIGEGDDANLLEEITDFKWYACVLAKLKGISLWQAVLDVHPYYDRDTKNAHGAEERVMIAAGTLIDVIKRESCYGKAKYNGELVTGQKLEYLIYDCVKAVDELFYEHIQAEDLDIELGYDRVIEKLHKVRYKNGYSDEAALNRDLDAEKKAIDGNA